MRGFPPLHFWFSHKRYSSNRLLVGIPHPDVHGQAVFSECMEVDVELVSGLGDWDQVATHFYVLWLAFQYLGEGGQGFVKCHMKLLCKDEEE